MRILIVDDHEIFRLGLADSLLEFSIADTVLEAGSMHAARQFVAAEHHDLGLVILDHGLPDGRGLDLLIEIQAKYASLRIVMLSAYENLELMQKSIDAGATGFIPKSTSTAVLLGAIKLILAGGIYIPPSLYAMSKGSQAVHVAQYKLTRRQREVLTLICRGYPNKKIATELGVCESTVRAHVTVILKAHGVSSRTQLLVTSGEDNQYSLG